MILSESMAAKTTQKYNWREALAKIVAPETLTDIDEYIQPTFPNADKNTLPTDGNRKILHAYPKDRFQRRIVVDGFGRWREIRPEEYSRTSHTDRREQLARDKKFQEEASKSFPLITPKLHGRQFSQPQNGGTESSSNPGNAYEHLSTNLRSNIFPGIGRTDWKSTTSKIFQEKNVTPPWKRKEFHGLKTDYFGEWSAANVHHEKMKRKWDEYLSAAPKFKANWSAPDPSQVALKKLEKDAKPRKTNVKQKPKRELTPLPMIETPIFDKFESPPLPGIDLPADDKDDNFWEFFDKPFNKPN